MSSTATAITSTPVTLDCGHPTVTGGILGPEIARDRDGATSCYPCAHAREIEALAAADTYVGYVSADGRNFTTWTGFPLGRVTFEGNVFRTPSGGKVQHYDVTTPDGRRWYGRGSGRGMALGVRVRKS